MLREGASVHVRERNTGDRCDPDSDTRPALDAGCGSTRGDIVLPVKAVGCCGVANQEHRCGIGPAPWDHTDPTDNQILDQPDPGVKAIVPLRVARNATRLVHGGPPEVRQVAIDAAEKPHRNHVVEALQEEPADVATLDLQRLTGTRPAQPDVEERRRHVAGTLRRNKCQDKLELGFVVANVKKVRKIIYIGHFVRLKPRNQI